MNEISNMWRRLPATTRVAAIVIAAVTALSFAAFVAGMSGDEQGPATQPAAPTTPVVPSFTPPPATHISPKPTASADDDVTATAPSPTAKPDPIREAGVTFVAAWLNTSGTPTEWRAKLTVSEIGSFRPRYVTPELKATILDPAAPMDPESVPVGTITRDSAAITVTSVADGIADVAVPVVNAVMDRQRPQPVGTVTVTMLERDGRWLVSEIDWSPV